MAGHVGVRMARGLPRPFAERLGRIVFRYTHVEHYLLLVWKRAAGVSISHARANFAMPAWPQQYDRIMQASRMKALTLSEPSGLRNLLEKTEARRNLLVHSAWRSDEKGLCVFKTRNAHATNPQRVDVDIAYLTDARRQVDECLRGMRSLCAQTDHLVDSMRNELIR